MSIQEHLNKIRNAVFGSEVRESIAKGIETAYNDASEKDNANMEVKMARGTNPNLNTRLNKMEETDRQTTAQLAHTVKYEENESITKRMLSQDIKEDLNNGEIEFKLNTSEIEEGAISHPKIDKSLRESFVDPETSILNTVQLGGTSGTPFERAFSTTTALSNPITCMAGETWSVSLADPIAVVYFYNELDEPLINIQRGTAPKDEPFTFTVPELEGLHHFRVNMRTSIIPIEEYLILKGDDINLGMKTNLDWLEVSDNNIKDKGILTKKIEGHIQPGGLLPVQTFDWLENRLELLDLNNSEGEGSVPESSRFTNANVIVTGDSITEKKL